MAEQVTPKRCAIYVRKSTEQGLDQEYNSLDAQRDAALAYIKSQSANGWRFEKEYRDGGFSGGNTNRPALKEMIQDVRDKKIDIVVVYKIDRLSRSLGDFSRIHSILEQNEVGFISVTQQLDTSNATGRMVMNILASFSQFEREMIRDRIRDKIRASLRLGMFMGGRVPYGYNLVDHKLVPSEKNAENVRLIFHRFIRSKSTERIAKFLNDQGIEREPGKKWSAGMVKTLLKDPRYIGKCRCAGNLYDGKHEAIVDDYSFERVQSILSKRKRPRNPQKEKRPKAPHPLLRVLKFGHGVLKMLDTKKAERVQSIREALEPPRPPSATDKNTL